MRYLIGTDEAGYGPNLGPLVVTATAWQVDGGADDACLYDLLSAAVSRTAPRRGDERLHLADSKSVYTPSAGLAALERGVLSLLGLQGDPPSDWRAAWTRLAPAAWDELAASDCYREFACQLPLEAKPADIALVAERLRAACTNSGVKLLAIASRAVFPGEFNALTESEGNKAGALSCVTLRLAAELLEGLPDGSVDLTCDKHGGRNTYAPLLQQHVTESWVESHGEGREESSYRFGPPERRVIARFCCQAERFLPVAAASMVSKYLRELAMRAFNAFWQSRVPELKPTAGYPLDARRFKREIAAAQQKLGLDDRQLWRVK